jgi:murein DD-endopeptidase MepM/ murein hydrolase activator NlpD
MRLPLLVMGALSSACVTTSASSGFTVRDHRELDLVSAPGEVRHRVEKGQTLYRIARTYGLSVDELMRANAIDDPRELKVGEWLRIPGAEAPKAKVVEADSPEPTPPARAVPRALEKRAPKVLTKVGTAAGPLAWPVRGVLYARFGRKGKEPHDGIDLAAPAGTPVKTAAPGTTLYAGEQKGYGLIVIVEHGGGLITLYAHNRDVRVKTGQKVREGQVVATVGDSGKTSGPHLHFEVRKDGVPVDPLEYLGPVPPPEGAKASPSVSAER